MLGSKPASYLKAGESMSYRIVFCLFFLGACSRTDTPTPSPQTLVIEAAAPVTPPETQCDHVFVAQDLILCATASTLVARHIPNGKILWNLVGTGALQDLIGGDFGRGPHIYAAWGRGRGQLDAPIVLQEIDAASGTATELWHLSGARTDVSGLFISDIDRDGKPELALNYFASKYMVKLRAWKADLIVIDKPEIRMATSRAFADLNGDGIADDVIGRVYGDDAQAPGDLRIDLGKGPLLIPTDRGVRSLLVATLGSEASPSLYFADGWAQSYAKEAKAQVKRAHWGKDGFVVDTVATSPDEYSFEKLLSLDVDGDGRAELVAVGNKRCTIFSPHENLPWKSRSWIEDPVAIYAGFWKNNGRIAAVLPGANSKVVFP